MDLKTKKMDSSEKSITESRGRSSASKASGNITEKNRKKPSSVQFANIIEKINEGFVALDGQMNYIYINERGSEILKRNPEDLIGKNYWDEFPEDKNTSFGQAYLRALETQTSIEIEDYYAPEDRWFENRIYPTESGLSIFFNDVTERKRAEEALRESEERFQTLANGSPVLLWVNGLEGCEFVNREYLDFLGLGTQTDVRGYDWSDYVHPDDREAYMAAYLQAFEKQAIFSAEFRFRRHDGEYRWMRSEATPRRAADGSLLGYVGATIDITVRKRVEQALREKDQQFRRVTDVTPTLFSQCSSDFRYLFVNHAAAELLGYPAEEIVGKPIRQIMGNRAFEVILPYLERVLKGERIEFETEIPYQNAGPRFMHVVYVPDMDEKGNVVGWIATVADITERRRAEEKMRLSEERFRQAADAAGALVYEVDLVSGATAIVHGMESIVGYDPQKTEMTSDWWHSLIHPEDLPVHLTQLNKHLGKGGTHISEYRVRHQSGIWINVQDNRLVIQDGAEQAIRLIGAVTNITERKRTELALAEFARQQEALYQLTDRLQHTKSQEDIFNAALDAILRALQCDRASILLFDKSDVMRFVAWRGLSEEYRKATDGHSPWKPDDKNPEPICMNDVDTAELSDSLRTIVKTEGIGSLAFIPLVFNGKLIGKFMAYFNEPHAFTERETELSLTIAHQLAIGIERKRDEDALRRSEERLRLATQAARMFTWELDIRTQSSKVADNFAQAMGFSPDLIPKDNEEILEQFIHPEDPQVILEALSSAVQNHRDQFSVQYRILNPENGQTIWLDVNGKVIYDQNGDPERMFGVAQNITESKQAEKRLTLLAEISELARNLEDPIDLMYSISKAVGMHLQVKRCLFNETDLEKDLEIVHRDYHDGVDSVAGRHKVSDYSSITSAEMMAGKTVVNHDSQTDPRTAQDYEKTYEQTGERAYVAVPLMRENRWVGSFWVSDDRPRQWSPEEVSLLETVAERTWTVIEKLRINTALRESESRYRFIVENTSDGIWHIELTEPMPNSLPEDEQLDWYYNHAVIGQCNLELARMYGYDSVEEVVGLPMAAVMPRENPVNLELSRKFIRSGYRLVDAESREVDRDGRELVFLNNMVGEIEDGKLKGEWGTNRDITERKRLEEERSQALEREQALRANAEQAKAEAEQAKAEAERELAERRLAEAALGEWADAPLPQDKRPALLRYGAALAVTLIAILVRVIFNPLLGETLSLVTIYGAVAFSVWYGGVGPAILSVLFGYVAITGLIIEPRNVVVLNAQNVTGLVLFLFSNTVVMALGETMRRAQRHAHQSARVAVERQHQAETQLREKQIAEESLRQSEALYRGIARNIPGGGVYVIDKDFRYLVSEGPVTEAFGLSREMLEGHTVSEVFPKEPAEKMENRLQRNFAGETVDFETKHNERFYWTQQAPMLDSLGNIGNAIVVTIDITERKQVEEALRRSEERFARFMQYLPGLAWIKDIDGRYVYANDAAAKAFSTPREQLYGRTDEEVFPAQVAAQFRKNDDLALMEGKGVQVTETLEHEDGVLHYSLVNKFPIPGPDGNMSLIGGTAFDITERKQAEEALRESEERFHAILRQATAGIVRKDAEGRLTFVNQAFCNMLDCTEPELLGKTIWELTHADDLEENKRLYDRMMLEGIPFKLEKRLIRRDGSTLWVDVSVAPIMDATGKPQSAVAVEVDITGRKQAEEALRESKELYRHLFDTVPVAVYTCDADGLIQEFNQRAVELWGREPNKNDPNEKFCGSFKIYYPDGRFMSHEQCPMARMLKGEKLEPHELEILVERPDGSRRNIIPHPLALRNERDEIVGAINCLYDFTERKQAEEELQQLNVQLESRVQKRTVELQAAIKSLQDEIAERQKAEDALHESRKRLQILSQRLVDVQEEERRAIARELHDRVGQSLSALNINLVILDNQISTQVPEQIRTRLDDSMQLVAETITLVRDVMSDLRPPVLDDYGLEAALQSHINLFKARYGIEVNFEKSDQPIPRLGSSIEMTFLRIAQEALINVARHAEAEQVDLSLRQDDKVVRLIVQDNGSGIKSWEQANRPGSHGLTIMRERAEAFGGELRVSSIPGKGVKVDASIPIDAESQGNAEKERQE